MYAVLAALHAPEYNRLSRCWRDHIDCVDQQSINEHDAHGKMIVKQT